MRYLILVLLIPFAMIGQQDWHLAKDQNGISIWTRDFKDSPYKEYKAVTYIDTTIEDVIGELLDAPKYMENCQVGVSHLIGMISSSEYLFYAKNKLPWPLRNRDVISKLTIDRHAEHKVSLHIEAAPQELPVLDDALRIKELNGYWLIEKQGDIIKVTQQLYINPEGSLPAFVTNKLLVKGPYKTFTELKGKLETS